MKKNKVKFNGVLFTEKGSAIDISELNDKVWIEGGTVIGNWYDYPGGYIDRIKFLIVKLLYRKEFENESKKNNIYNCSVGMKVSMKQFKNNQE